MPYEFEEIKLIELTAENAWDLEQYLHRQLKEFSYKPKIKFGGSTECFFGSEDRFLNLVNGWLSLGKRRNGVDF